MGIEDATWTRRASSPGRSDMGQRMWSLTDLIGPAPGGRSQISPRPGKCKVSVLCS